ncbi:MAG: hypothetical protein AAFQ94_27350 [Bacteroidota bacterium]
MQEISISQSGICREARNSLLLKTISILLLAGIAFFVPNSLSAQVPKTIPVQSKDNSQLIIIPKGEALNRKFIPLHPERPNGPRLQVISGNPDKGPSFTLFRYSRNYAGSGTLHNHSHNYSLWLIEGAMKHWDATGSEKTAQILLPGSYLYQPANEFHAANCLTERCTAYVVFDGLIDTSFPKKESPLIKDH